MVMAALIDDSEYSYGYGHGYGYGVMVCHV